MMDSNPFKLFSLFFFLGMVSCGAPQPRASSGERSPAFTKQKPSGFQAAMASPESISGTIAVVQVVLPEGTDPASLKGEFEGTEIPFFPLSMRKGEKGIRYSGLVGVPFERAAGPAKVIIQVGKDRDLVKTEVPFTVSEGQYPSETLKVNGRRVMPTSKKDLARIIREQAEISEIYKRVSLQKYWQGPFLMPIESAVTSPYGSKRVYNGKLKSYHSGLDLKARTPTPIFASAPGKIVLSKNLFYTGNTVIIDHGYGVMTLYAHLSSLGVKPGQLVKSREQIGLSGKTGRVNGPHLHWTAIVNRVKVNPLGLVQEIKE